MRLPWTPEPMSVADRAITDSIKALRTLRLVGGRVSIDPSEVLGQPGYLEARRRAAELLTPMPGKPSWRSWEEVDADGIGLLMRGLINSLQRSRAQGLSFEESLKQLSELSHN